MIRSPFADASFLFRGVFAFAVLALILGFVFHPRISSRVMAQQPSEAATAVVVSDTTKAAPATAAVAATDIFLELAARVGQAAPAQRLIDYKLKNDPASRPRFYAIVDFDQPSTSKRFYVFDTLEKRVSSYYVAHGRGSEGAAGDNIPAVFSNQNKSNSSSLGIYRTLNEYNGQHGRSLRLEGLEPTNSNALDRAIVMHRASYCEPSHLAQYGKLGRSNGCFAMSDEDFKLALLRLAGGRLLYADKIGIGPNGEQVTEPPKDLELLIPEGIPQPPLVPGAF